jgi:hypothetical protein
VDDDVPLHFDLVLVLADLGFVRGHLEVAAAAIHHADLGGEELRAARLIRDPLLVLDADVLLRSLEEDDLARRADDDGLAVLLDLSLRRARRRRLADLEVHDHRKDDGEQAQQEPDGTVPVGHE